MDAPSGNVLDLSVVVFRSLYADVALLFLMLLLFDAVYVYPCDVFLCDVDVSSCSLDCR